MEKMRFETKNITNENIQKILELFPNVATEAIGDNGELKTAIDFDKLKQELSEVVIDGEESYNFTWVGKKEAMVEANRPIRKTLRPDRESSVDWENTQNIYIEGDNLEALKLLQESYLGKVKMIYIDPPYNTGNDFVYRDNFTKDKDIYNEELGVNDEEGNKLFKNTESNGRFHSDWCSMIYSRLKLARNLLSDDGVIFISIDDNEVDNLRKICDEIFGSENFVNSVAVKMSTAAGLKMSNKYKKMIKIKEYILVYSKKTTFEFSDINALYVNRDKYETERSDKYIENFEENPLNWYFCSLHEAYTKYKKDNETKIDFVNNNYKRIFNHVINASTKKNWENLNEQDKYKYKNKVRYYNVAGSDYQYAYNDHVLIPYNPKILDGDMWCSNFAIGGTKSPEGGVVFTNGKKPIKLLNRILKISTKENDIILDFFSGSASTAHAIMQVNAEDGGNRKFIMIQIAQKIDKDFDLGNDSFLNICELGEERIRRAGKKIQEENPDKKIDVGFRVFKVDDTNMKDVYYTPSEFTQQKLKFSEKNIKEDRTDEDLLYGCLLDWGVELSLPHKVEIIENKRVHIVDEDALVACFEDEVSESVMRKIAEIKPTRVVFKDGSFVGDANKINVEEIFKLISPETTVKVI